MPDNKYSLDVVNIRLVNENQIYSDMVIDGPDSAIEAVGEVMRGFDREVIAVINLDSKGHPLNVNFASVGTIDIAIAMPREILKSGILSNASSIIMLHNHPSGIPEPSSLDVNLTDRINQSCDLLGLKLLDHVIVGDKKHGYFSFHEKKMLKSSRLVFETDYHNLNIGMDRTSFKDAFASDAEKYFETISASERKAAEKHALIKFDGNVSPVEPLPLAAEDKISYDDFYRRIYMRLDAIPQDMVKLERGRAPEGVSTMTYDRIIFTSSGNNMTEPVFMNRYYLSYKSFMSSGGNVNTPQPSIKDERVYLSEMASEIAQEYMTPTEDISLDTDNPSLYYGGMKYTITDIWMNDASDIFLTAEKVDLQTSDSKEKLPNYIAVANGEITMDFGVEPTRTDIEEEYRITKRYYKNVDKVDPELLLSASGKAIPDDTWPRTELAAKYLDAVDAELNIRKDLTGLITARNDTENPLFAKESTYALQCMQMQLNEINNTGRITLASDVTDLKVKAVETDPTRGREMCMCECNVRGKEAVICFSTTPARDTASLVPSPRPDDLSLRLMPTEIRALEEKAVNDLFPAAAVAEDVEIYSIGSDNAYTAAEPPEQRIPTDTPEPEAELAYAPKMI